MPTAEFTATYPPSVNSRYVYFVRKGKVDMAKSQDVLAYEQEIMYKVYPLKHNGSLPKEPIRGNVVLKCLFYPPKGNRQDIDNPSKALLDALTLAGVWQNDRQVIALLSFRDDRAKIVTDRSRGLVKCKIIWGKDLDIDAIKGLIKA